MYRALTIFALLATVLGVPAPEPKPVYAPVVYPPPLYHPPVYRTLHPAPVAVSHVSSFPVLPAAYRTVLPAAPAVLPASPFLPATTFI